MEVPERAPETLAEDIQSNPTIFGRLLRREAPVRVLYDSEDYFAFRNIKPYAPLAGLVIPKRFMLQDPDGLDISDLPVLERMRDVGLAVAKEQQPDAFKRGDFRLCFHRPPFSSVPHLHLHVLAPVSRFPSWTSLVFLAPSPWAIDVDDVINHLRSQQRPKSPPPPPKNTHLTNNS